MIQDELLALYDQMSDEEKNENHGYCKKAKRTRRYLLGHRHILKKGRLYHTLRKSIFSKGKRRLDFISNRR